MNSVDIRNTIRYSKIPQKEGRLFLYQPSTLLISFSKKPKSTKCTNLNSI